MMKTYHIKVISGKSTGAAPKSLPLPTSDKVNTFRVITLEVYSYMSIK